MKLNVLENLLKQFSLEVLFSLKNIFKFYIQTPDAFNMHEKPVSSCTLIVIVSEFT